MRNSIGNGRLPAYKLSLKLQGSVTETLDLNNLRRCFTNLEQSSIGHFYPDRNRAAHSIYSPGWDRFLIVDHFELSVVMHAAKLLSSKMALNVFVLPLGHHIDRTNSLRWTIREKTSRLSDGQTPVLKVLTDLDSVIEVGLPAADESVVDDQGFVAFALRATYAVRLTDLLLNTADHPYYLKFFEAPHVSPLPFRKHFDETKWPNGFVHAIEKIIYLSTSVDEALAQFTRLMPAEIKNATLNNYAQTFYSFLGWKPGSPA